MALTFRFAEARDVHPIVNLPTGETRPFPYGADRVGILKRSDLHFVVLAKPLT